MQCLQRFYFMCGRKPVNVTAAIEAIVPGEIWIGYTSREITWSLKSSSPFS